MVKLSDCYKLWHGYLIALPRHTKFTVGTKIDNLFTDCLELALRAGYSMPEKKRDIIFALSAKIDMIKFFLKLLWEMKALDTKKYSVISSSMNEIGKMAGGWIKIFK